MFVSRLLLEFLWLFPGLYWHPPLFRLHILWHTPFGHSGGALVRARNAVPKRRLSFFKNPAYRHAELQHRFCNSTESCFRCRPHTGADAPCAYLRLQRRSLRRLNCGVSVAVHGEDALIFDREIQTAKTRRGAG